MTTYLAFSVGLLLGFCFGCVMWKLLVADHAARKAEEREHRLRDRIGIWQEVYMLEIAERLGLVDDNDRWSRKAPDIRRVK